MQNQIRGLIASLSILTMTACSSGTSPTLPSAPSAVPEFYNTGGNPNGNLLPTPEGFTSSHPPQSQTAESPQFDYETITPIAGVVEVTDLPGYDGIPKTITGLKETNRGFLLGTSDNKLNTTGLSNALYLYGRRQDTLIQDGYNDGYVYSRFHNVVAIFPSTNLGAPLPIGQNQDANTTWAGTYSLKGYSIRNAPINLTINFQTGEMDARFLIGESETDYFILDATFDRNGAVEGTFTAELKFSTDILGNVIGLIGEQGTVGVFYGASTSSSSYAGGFVADNPNNND
ncbi:MAG: hypothetical protein K8953_00270 [Proteobacteria bacterium]|nr:hypothetical protein [Pseudomonadota bacterium]